MHSNTYSLKAILQSDLDPTLCKLMLHEIKSPLLQHSFQLTTDDEYNSGSVTPPTYSGYYRNKQKQLTSSRDRYIDKMQLDKKQLQFQRMHQRLNQMSSVMSDHETSRRYQIPTNHKRKTNQKQQTYISPKNIIHKQPSPIISSNKVQNQINFVSPLQLNQNMLINSQNITQKQNKIPQNLFILAEQISQQNRNLSSFQNSQQNNGNGVEKWCGEIFDTKNAYEILIDDGEFRPFTRRKIFGNKTKNAKKTKDLTKPQCQYFSFNQSIRKLHAINQQQLAKFIQFIYSCLCLLQQLSPYRNTLQTNQPILNKILLTDNPVDHTPRETISNKNRILNRLHVSKMSQALSKIIQMNDYNNTQRNKSNISQSKNRRQMQQKIQTDVSKILQIYSEIQDLIQDYVCRDNIINQLTQIYNMFYDKQIQCWQNNNNNTQKLTNINSPVTKLEQKNNTQQISKPLSQNPHYYQPSPQSLKQKLQKLFISLKINPQHYKNLQQLSYIWSSFNIISGYSPTSIFKYKINKQKFINQICRNDILVHQANKKIVQLNIQQKLTSLGFKRNSDTTQL